MMQRYQGEALADDAKVAILANDALGNFAICTPIAKAFRRDCPRGLIDFYGGERTRELEEASVGDLIDFRASLLGAPFGGAIQTALERAQEIGGYDLVLNIEVGSAHKAFSTALGARFVCGPALSPHGRGEWDFPDDLRGDLWRDKNWIDPSIAERYPFLQDTFIGEIFFRLAYREGSLPRYRFPSATPPFSVPKVLISTGASLPEKLWPVSKWREFLQGTGEEVGLLGAPPKRQAEFYHSTDDEQSLVEEGLLIDLRGKLTLPEVVGALSTARAVVTIDNGILHFAAAHDVPTVGLYRKEIASLWAPPNRNLVVLTPMEGTVAEISVDSVRTAFNALGQR